MVEGVQATVLDTNVTVQDIRTDVLDTNVGIQDLRTTVLDTSVGIQGLGTEFIAQCSREQQRENRRIRKASRCLLRSGNRGISSHQLNCNL